jgi:hypothetical protein
MSGSVRALRPIEAAQRPWLLIGGFCLLPLAIAKLLTHLYANRYSRSFTDELYYLACVRHLVWGYVNQPPLIADISRLGAVRLIGRS